MVAVLVIGAGPGGLAATGAAREAGADVLVIERSADAGGAARWGRVQFLFSGTDMQAAAGIADGPEVLLADWAEITGGDPDRPWVQAYAQRNTEVYTLLTAHGAEFTLDHDTRVDAGSVIRLHEVGADQMVSALLSRLSEDNQRFDTEALSLVRDRVRRVVGVQTAEGWIRAGHVIVATGGMLRDVDRVRTVRPDLEDTSFWFATPPTSDGSGHDMVQEIGAGMRGLDRIGILAHGFPDPVHEGEALGAENLQAQPWVDATGARFVDERTAPDFITGDAVVEAGPAWVIYDATAWGSLYLFDLMPLEDEMTPSGREMYRDSSYFVHAETLGGLAWKIGVDTPTLAETLRAWNASVSGEPDAFRNDMPAMAPVGHTDIRALRIAPVLSKCFGGIRVDTTGRVLDTSGRVIKGLWAAGEATGMIGGSIVAERGWAVGRGRLHRALGGHAPPGRRRPRALARSLGTRPAR